MYRIVKGDNGEWLVVIKAGDTFVLLSKEKTHADALAVRQMYINNDEEEEEEFICYDNGIDYL